MNHNKDMIKEIPVVLKEILFSTGKKKADISLIWSRAFETIDKKKSKADFELISGIQIIHLH